MLKRTLVIVGCLCALTNCADGQVWNRSRTRSFGTSQPSNAARAQPATTPAISEPARDATSSVRQQGELPEPKADLQLPSLESQRRFELNQGAFAKPHGPAIGSSVACNQQTGQSFNKISSGQSSRPLPRLANQQTPAQSQRMGVPKSPTSAGTANRNQVTTQNQTAATDSDSIHTANDEASGPVSAPMPQRLNGDGTRTPIASFGEWDVRRNDGSRQSMRAATLTDDESKPLQSPSFHVPMQNIPRQSESTSTQFDQLPAQGPHDPAGTVPQNPSIGPGDSQLPYPSASAINEHGHEMPSEARPSANQIAESPALTPVEGLYWWEKELAGSLLKDRPPMPMSLPEALQSALNEAPELKILHAEWYIRMQEQIRQDAAFDWTTFVNSVWNRDSSPVGSQLDGATQRLRSRTASAAAGLRRLDRHGGQFEISQQLGLRESNSQFISPNYQGNSRLNLRYERPLLRGAGKEYATGPLQLSELDKDIAFDRMQSGIQDHLLEVARAYWALVLTRGDFLQKITSWNRARVIAEEMKSREEIDVTPGTLDRARAEVSSRLAASIQAEHDVQAAQEVLLELIYASRFTEFTRNEVITTTLPPHAPTSVDVESQAEIAVQTRSEVHQAIREIRAATIEQQLSQIDMKPRLDLVLSGYAAGLNPNYDVGNSFVNQFNQGEPGAGMGLEYELPYKNRAAKAAAEQKRIAVTRLQREFEDVVGEVKQDVRSQAIRRNKFAATLPQQAESLILAKRLMEYTQTRRDFLADGVQVGDLYLTDLLQIQSRVQNAEYQYLQAQVSFAVADNAFLRSLSSLQTLADNASSASIPTIASSAPEGSTLEPGTKQAPTGSPLTLPSLGQFKRNALSGSTPYTVKPVSATTSRPAAPRSGHAGPR